MKTITHFKKNIFVLSLLILVYMSSHNISAQKSVFLDQFIPMNPTAESAISNSRTNSEVDMHTGRLNFGIPIYNINSGGISASISLNYNNEGIRVNEESGIAGLVVCQTLICG